MRCWCSPRADREEQPYWSVSLSTSLASGAFESLEEAGLGECTVQAQGPSRCWSTQRGVGEVGKLPRPR